MEILGKLMGSETKVKIIRLFLFNPETVFETSVIAERVKEDVTKVRRELNGLKKISFVRGRVKKHAHKKSTPGFVMNQNFLYLTPLRTLLISGKPLQPKEILRKISSLGSVKLLVVAGVFLQNTDSRVDLLIVGDNLKKTSLEQMVKKLEAEIGTELRYAYFGTADFLYRFSMYDKLVRDILEYPHEKLVNKLALT
jgi:hypothetical protein